MSVHPLNPRMPGRLSALDIVALTDVEVRAVMIHLAGHRDPAIAEAVALEVRATLEVTRGPAPAVDAPGLKLDRGPDWRGPVT